jgi:hypothetical protein
LLRRRRLVPEIPLIQPFEQKITRQCWVRLARRLPMIVPPVRVEHSIRLKVAPTPFVQN